MKPRTLLYFARIKPLAAWTISGSALGVGLALYLTSWNIVALLPMLLAVLAVILMQYVAHPLNDIMDYDLDRQAPIAATGRVKPLVSGLISMREAKWLSAAFVGVILVILLYLIILQPVLLFPAAYGMVALMGYNHSKLRLAYKPYTELYLSMPINALAVFVISFIGSGQATWVAGIVSIIFGFASSTFFVSMMSMDFPTDMANGKTTTVGKYPRLRWCTYYPAIGLVLALLSPVVLYQYLGALPTLFFVIISAAVFSLLIVYGLKADNVRLQYLDGATDNPEGESGYIRLRQLYLSTAYAFSLAILFAILGA